jgi:hypothetical protein
MYSADQHREFARRLRRLAPSLPNRRAAYRAARSHLALAGALDRKSQREAAARRTNADGETLH